MISVQEALQVVQKNLLTRSVEAIPIKNALNCVLGADIFAREPMPQFTNSAMDGFAVRWEDIRQANEDEPVVLKIVGESQAGIPFGQKISRGEAIRISTGGMLCEGADAVVPVEETRVDGDRLHVLNAKKQHQHVRFEGEEYKPGDLLLPKGTPLQPAQIAVLASQGIAEAPVYAPPAVSIIGTGSELVPYFETPQPGQIRDSNVLMLSLAVEKSGGKAVRAARVSDNFDATVQTVQKAANVSQIILFTGGVSVGPHDFVKRATRECGFETIFWRVRQKPGKPLFFARKGETLFFGLPGNPVSAYMCYLYYVHPVLQHLSGRNFSGNFAKAILAERIQNTLNRAQFFRVRLENSADISRAYPLKKQGSHMLTTVSSAGGFIFLDIDADLPAGKKVDVIPFV